MFTSKLFMNSLLVDSIYVFAKLPKNLGCFIVASNLPYLRRGRTYPINMGGMSLFTEKYGKTQNDTLNKLQCICDLTT